MTRIITRHISPYHAIQGEDGDSMTDIDTIPEAVERMANTLDHVAEWFDVAEKHRSIIGPVYHVAGLRKQATALRALSARLTESESEIEKLNAAIKRQSGAARTIQQTTAMIAQNENERLRRIDRSEYNAAATLDSERDANARLTTELEAAETERDMLRAALEWMASGDTGSSSESIAYHMLGITGRHARVPLDSGDLGRCIRLLDLMPQWQPRMVEMAQYGGIWASYAEAWPDLTEKYRASPDSAYTMMRIMRGATPC